MVRATALVSPRPLRAHITIDFALNPDDCPLQCHNGRQVDAAGRELCQCRQIASDDFDNFRHTAKANEDIDILSNPSSSGYLALSDNEAIHCPKFHCSRICTHGFQLNQRGCPICKCQRCKSIQDCHKKCTLGLIHDSRGCPTCQCRSPLNSDLVSSTAVSHCKAGNTSYTYGDRWKINDCTSCICHHGGPTCTEIICPLPCPNPIFITVRYFLWAYCAAAHWKWTGVTGFGFFHRGSAVRFAVVTRHHQSITTLLATTTKVSVDIFSLFPWSWRNGEGDSWAKVLSRRRVNERQGNVRYWLTLLTWPWCMP